MSAQNPKTISEICEAISRLATSVSEDRTSLEALAETSLPEREESERRQFFKNEISRRVSELQTLAERLDVSANKRDPLTHEKWVEREAADLREMHPTLASKSVQGFEAMLNKHIHLNYAHLINQGVLVRDVEDGGNRDARLSAAATALTFISREEINSPLFSEICRRISAPVVVVKPLGKRITK